MIGSGMRARTGLWSVHVNALRNNLDASELNVFTFCLYNGKFVHFGDDFECGAAEKTKKRSWEAGLNADRWEAAEEKASLMLAECGDVGPSAKVATLRKLTKGCKAQIKFKR